MRSRCAEKDTAALRASPIRHELRLFGVDAAPTVGWVSPDPRRGTGKRGEMIAAELLERLGYAVLERNFRTREGELDLVASRNGTLVFCEVKALVSRPGGPSAGPATPLEAVGPAKRNQVRRVARVWLGARHDGSRRRWRTVRFDAIGVLLSPGGEIVSVEHVENAF
jgi:putative endonuclease